MRKVGVEREVSGAVVAAICVRASLVHRLQSKRSHLLAERLVHHEAKRTYRALGRSAGLESRQEGESVRLDTLEKRSRMHGMTTAP